MPHLTVTSSPDMLEAVPPHILLPRLAAALEMLGVYTLEHYAASGLRGKLHAFGQALYPYDAGSEETPSRNPLRNGGNPAESIGSHPARTWKRAALPMFGKCTGP